MGIILDFNDFDSHKPLNGSNALIRLPLEKELGVFNGKIQKIQTTLSIERISNQPHSILYDDFSEVNNSFRVLSDNRMSAYKDGDEKLKTLRFGSKNIAKMLNSSKLSNKEKSDIEHTLNIYMFYEKYLETYVTMTKRQTDYLISVFRPYLDFTKPLSERVALFLGAINKEYDYYSVDKKLQLTSVGLDTDVLPSGEKFEYGNGWLQVTLDPVDIRSLVDSWNVICEPNQKIELINCPGYSKITVSSLLDLGNEFYDKLKAKDARKVEIQEI